MLALIFHLEDSSLGHQLAPIDVAFTYISRAILPLQYTLHKICSSDHRSFEIKHTRGQSLSTSLLVSSRGSPSFLGNMKVACALALLSEQGHHAGCCWHLGC
ncbi:hypothetical protein WJX79_004752 [Trebouxia sp. C0005]